MAEISVKGLTKTFGRVRAVDDMTFNVSAGQVTGFLGPNGAGKTTTFRLMLGLMRPTAGQALIDGHSYQDLKQPRRVVGAVLEATGFHPDNSGRNHLRIQARAIGVAGNRVDEVLDQVDLTADAERRIGGYSLGMKQRLGLAAALLGDPAILILDEPANGLDPGGIAWLRSILRRFANEGRTVLVSSHVLSEVAQTVDRVVIVSKGRLRFSGKLAELGDQIVSVRTAETERLRAAITRRGYTVSDTNDLTLTVSGASTEQIGRLAADEGIALSALTGTGTSLEAAFLRLTSADLSSATDNASQPAKTA